MTSPFPLWRRLWCDIGAASTVEFVMVLPVLLIFIFGAIDLGSYGWRLNRLEKATQMGARFAVVTNPVASGLVGETYLGKSVTVNGTTSTLGQGDTIPKEALGLITCTSSSCTCKTAPCPTDLTRDSTAFQNLVTRMANFDPTVSAAKVQVEYRGSGIGFAGDPDGMEIVPLVTVRLLNMRYQPITGLIFNAAVDMPDFAFTLPMEDGSGTASN